MSSWKLLLAAALLCAPRAAAFASRATCDVANYRSVQNAAEDVLIYGITQDCQMFFIRPSQLHLLSSIRVDKRHSFCYSNLVQLHVKAHDTLLLTFKQASNRICTLEVHIPSLSMLFGDHLFRYSLLNSLPYASCSHSKDHSFQLEPDLSFMDPVYNDVIYFIDALSSGSEWKVLQFLLKDTGSMSMMNNLTVSVQNTKGAAANEFVVSLDNQRDKLYRKNRFESVIHQQCAFEMLFRPNEAEVNTFETPSRGYGAILNGQSVDGDLMVYAETDRTVDPSSTRLNILSTDYPEHVACLSATSFSFDVGIIRESTVQRLKNDPRPPFGTSVSPKPLKQKTHQKKLTTTTSTTTKASVTASVREATSSKPKGAYSPSKSFFSYEMGGTGTTTAESVMSNEIPKEKIEKEQQIEEEELNEIIKELKSDEEEEEEEEDRPKGVGELRARIREVNMTSEGTPTSSASNGTATSASSRFTSPISLIFISATLVYSLT